MPIPDKQISYSKYFAEILRDGGVLLFFRLVQIFLWKLFPPFEVRVVHSELNSFLQQQDQTLTSESKKILLNLVKRNPEKVIYSIRIDKLKADQIALLLVRQIYEDLLSMGYYHVYRGKLSMQGEAIYNTWKNAGEELLKNGYAAQKDLVVENHRIDTQIRQVG